MTQKWSHVPNSGNFHTNVITVIVCVISKDVELSNTPKMHLVQWPNLITDNFGTISGHQSEHSALLSEPIWRHNPWKQTVIFTLTYSLTRLRARSLTWTWPPHSSSAPVPVSCSVLCPVPVAENPRWSLLAASSALPLHGNTNTEQHLKLLFADTSHGAFASRCFRNKLEERNWGTYEYRLLLLVRQECVLADIFPISKKEEIQI